MRGLKQFYISMIAKYSVIALLGLFSAFPLQSSFSSSKQKFSKNLSTMSISLEDKITEFDTLGTKKGTSDSLSLSKVTHKEPYNLKVIPDYSSYAKIRPRRDSTLGILLHFSTGTDKGSLSWIKQEGLANYYVHEDGRVKRIIPHWQLAKHAGKGSMWNGKTNVAHYFIGIEIYAKNETDIINKSQEKPLAALIDELQKIYPWITDDDVFGHVNVIFDEVDGVPTRYRRYERNPYTKEYGLTDKVCFINMSSDKQRAKIGLAPGTGPKFDYDLEQGNVFLGATAKDTAYYQKLYRCLPGESLDVPLDSMQVMSLDLQLLALRDTSAIDTFVVPLTLKHPPFKEYIPSPIEPRPEEKDFIPKYDAYRKD